MKRTIKRMIIAGGIAVTLTGCGVGASNAGASNGAAVLASSGNPPDANAQPGAAPANNGQAPFGPGISGKVTSVNGDTLTVQDQRQQSTVTVKLTDSTQVFKRTSIALSSVPTGETVSAFGVQDGDVFTATRVTVGATAGQGGFGPGGAGQPGGTPPAGGNGGQPQGGQRQASGTAQPGRGPGGRIFGTVEQVSADALTVKTASGTTMQVRLATDGQVTQQVAGTKADITTGSQIMVMSTGQQGDTTVTATRVEVLAAQ
jgi:preprotein translocase subunit YajC